MSVIYNGTDLEQEFGLVCLGRGTYGAPARDIEQVHVPGRNGDLLIDNGGYLNFDITYPECTIQENFPYQARRLRNFLLSSPGYHKLTDSYNPGFYRQAEYRGPFAAEAHTARNNLSSVFDLVFNCKPLRYLDSSDVRLTLLGGGWTILPYIVTSDSLTVRFDNETSSSSRTINVTDMTTGQGYQASAGAGASASINIPDAEGHIVLIKIYTYDAEDYDIYTNGAYFYRHIASNANGFPETRFTSRFLQAECRTEISGWKGSIRYKTHDGSVENLFTCGYLGASTNWVDSETMQASNVNFAKNVSYYPPVVLGNETTEYIVNTTDSSSYGSKIGLIPRFCIL